MAYQRTYFASATTVARGLTKSRVYFISGTLVWKDTPYWGVDFKNSALITADLTTGERPYAEFIFDMLVPFQEQLRFNTAVLQSGDRTEQRIAKREGIPHQIFQFRSRIEKENWTSFCAILNKWGKRSWMIPLWAENTKYTGTLSSGSSTITLDTSYADYFSGGYAVIWKNPDEWEIILIDTVAAGSLTLSGTIANTYTEYCWIMPGKISTLQDSVDIENHHDHVIVEATTIANKPNAVTGFTPSQTYDSMAVLTKPSLLKKEFSFETHNPDMHILDYNTGLFTTVSVSDINETVQEYFWRCETKQACWELRQFFHYLNGRQVPFLVPTFEEDMELVTAVGPSDTDLYVTYSDLTDNMAANRYRNYIAFFQDGTIVVRKVTDISKEDADSDLIIDEKLTLDAAVGSTYTAGTKVCWVDKVRLQNNEVNFHWECFEWMECVVKMVRVP